MIDTFGRKGITHVEIETETGKKKKLECGFLAVSAGWNPNIHLTSHHRLKPVWNEKIQSFVAQEKLPNNMFVAGAAAGVFSTPDIFIDVTKKTEIIIALLGFKNSKSTAPSVECTSGK